MIVRIIERNGIKIADKRIVSVNPYIQVKSGLATSYPNATTPLADDDKFIVRQGYEWKEVKKNEIGGKFKHIQVNELPQTLEANAIYFVRNTGEIWQTDENSVGVRLGITPHLIEYGGSWKLYNGYYYYLNYNYGWNSISVAKIDSLNTLTKVVEANSALGKPIPMSGYRLSNISINYSCATHNGKIKVRVFSKRFKKNIKFSCSSADILVGYQLLADIEFDTIHYKQEYIEFHINSNYELEEGDIIVPILIAETGDYIILNNVTMKLNFI